MRIERIGDATLYLGDCREVLPMLGKVDAVVTDPPYGLGKRWSGNLKEWPLAADTAWDTAIIRDLASLLLAVASQAIIWGGHLYDLPPARGWLVWDKKSNGFSSGDCELAWSNIDQPVRVFRLARNIFTPVVVGWEKKEHAAQKPSALMAWCVSMVTGATVLDPFMGSGTTGVACARLGRRFVGIEVEPRYFDIACRRIEAEARQGRLAVDPAPYPKPVTAALL